ncbi:MAG: hypothetical protein ACHREM_16535 [Polyangiales bacterium]
MRRLIAVLACLALVSVLAACGGSPHVNPQTPIVVPPSPGPAAVVASPAASPTH